MIVIEPSAQAYPDSEQGCRWLYTVLTRAKDRLEPFSPSGRVDIVVLGQQGPVFRHRVLREGVLVVDANPTARHAFEGRTIAESLDWKPTHEIAMASALQGLRRRFSRRAP